MVTANVNQLGRQAEDALEERDVRGLAAVGVSAAGGVVLAQMAADIVLDALDMNVDPSSMIEYGTSIGTKAVVALVFGYIAAQTGGLVLVAAAFAGLGSLASAGTDLIEFLLTQDPLGGSSTGRVRSARSSTSTSASPSASGSSGAVSKAASNPF